MSGTVNTSRLRSFLLISPPPPPPPTCISVCYVQAQLLNTEIITHDPTAARGWMTAHENAPIVRSHITRFHESCVKVRKRQEEEEKLQ